MPELFTLVDAAGSFLSQQLVYSTLLCIGVFLVTRWMGQRWLYLQHGLWLLVVLRLVLPPGFAAPFSLRAQLDELLLRADVTREWTSTEVTLGAVEASRPGEAAAANPVPVVQTTEATISWGLVGLIWALGFCLAATRYLRQSLRFASILDRAKPVQRGEIRALAERWRRELEVWRPVQVLTSKEAQCPFTAGFWRPKIYLPARLLEGGAPATLLEPIIAHEMAHVRRWDYLWIRLLGWIQVVYFFHPVAWLAIGQLNRTRESLCDELVLERARVTRSAYGHSLLAVLRLQTEAQRQPAPLPTMSHQKRRFEMRMQGILNDQKRPVPARPWAWLLLALCAGFILPMAVSSAEPPEQANEPEAEVVLDEPTYVGEPIDLSIYRADLVKTLQHLAEVGNLNLVIEPGIEGLVTAELTGVPWDQALEQILKINNLTMKSEGTVVRIVPVSLLRQQAVEADQEPQVRTVLKTLTHAKAADALRALRAHPERLLSDRATVTVDEPTNTLIVREVPSNIDKVLQHIETLDALAGKSRIRIQVLALEVLADDDLVSMANELQHLPTAEIDPFLEKHEDAIRLLSAPQIVTLDGQPASVKTGLTSQSADSTPVKETLNLVVAPSLRDDKKLDLGIELRRSLSAETSADEPYSEYKTRTQVADGGSTVITSPSTSGSPAATSVLLVITAKVEAP